MFRIQLSCWQKHLKKKPLVQTFPGSMMMVKNIWKSSISTPTGFNSKTLVGYINLGEQSQCPQAFQEKQVLVALKKFYGHQRSWVEGLFSSVPQKNLEWDYTYYSCSSEHVSWRTLPTKKISVLQRQFQSHCQCLNEHVK